MRSRCHLPGSSVGGQADWVTSRSILDSQTEPLVDLVKLQSDVVKEYFTGKPLIQCFKSQPFRFRETVPSRSSIKTRLLHLHQLHNLKWLMIMYIVVSLALLWIWEQFSKSYLSNSRFVCCHFHYTWNRQLISILWVANFHNNFTPFFQHELKPVTRKNLEFYFHSSTFHVLQEVVIGLRTVAGHLIKVGKRMS